MDKISELKRNHVICFALIAILADYFIRSVMTSVLKYFEVINGSTNLDYMIYELVALAVACVMLYVCKQTHILKCGTKGLGRGLWSGMVFFLLAVLGCYIYTVEGMQYGNTAYKSLLQISAFVIFVILVGLAEEFLFRGVIADSIFECFGKSVSGVWFSVILSGVLFGISHITNILSGQTIEKTIIQMIAVSISGILFSAIYIRHKNIFATAILHAVLDFLTMFEEGFFENSSLEYVNVDIDFWASLRQSLMSQSIFLMAAIFVLRPQIIRKIAAQKETEKG